MGEIYSVFSPAFTPGAARHILRVLAVAEETLKLTRFWINTELAVATPIDLVLNRVTTAGTGSPSTATPMSQNAPAFGGDIDHNLSVAPTVSVEVMRWIWDAQVPFEWVFAPGEELIIPGVTDEGFSIEMEDDPVSPVVVGAIIETL